MKLSVKTDCLYLKSKKYNFLMDLFLKEIALNDVVMESLIKRLPKFSKKKSTTPFKDLIRSIISQQLSTKAANTIYNRFIDVVGNSFCAEDLFEINIEKIITKNAYILFYKTRVPG